MSLDAPFSSNDPRVLEAVEKQYLYGSTKDIIRNIERDIFNIINAVLKCHRLGLKYPDNISTMQLITIALVRLGKRYFSESDVKLLEVFRKRCHVALKNFMNIFDFHETSGYGRAASSLLGALYAMHPPRLGDDTSLSDTHGQPDGRWATVIGTVLGTIDSIERIRPLDKVKKGKKSSDTEG